MNILFITHVTSLGGANRSMLQLIKELKQNYSANIAVAGPSWDGVDLLKKKLNDINVEYIECPVLSFKSSSGFNIIKFTKYLLLLIKHRNYYKRLRPYNFDIVHSNSSIIDAGAFLSRQLGCKHVWHLREYGDIDYGFYPMGGILYEKYTYSHADAYIAISKSIANHYKHKVDKNKLHVIYNGIKECDDCYKALHEDPVINFFIAGYIHEGKNQKEIVLAVDELVNSRHIHNHHLTIIGKASEPYCTHLENIIKERNLTANVSILPETDGIQEIAAKMDVGIVSSRSEAFGRITIEYMLQNLLVIACDSGANPELIEDGKTGYLYEAGNHVALADKMEQVIMAKSFPTDVSEAGMAFAKKNFLSKYNTEKVYNLYCELLKRNNE